MLFFLLVLISSLTEVPFFVTSFVCLLFLLLFHVVFFFFFLLILWNLHLTFALSLCKVVFDALKSSIHLRISLAQPELQDLFLHM